MLQHLLVYAEQFVFPSFPIRHYRIYVHLFEMNMVRSVERLSLLEYLVF